MRKHSWSTAGGNNIEMRDLCAEGLVDFHQQQIQTPLIIKEQSNRDDEMSERKSTSTLRCRICLNTSSADHDTLVAPCKCSGSMKYVHTACIQTWAMTKSLPVSCEICRTPLDIVSRAIKLIRLNKDGIAYLIFILSCWAQTLLLEGLCVYVILYRSFRQAWHLFVILAFAISAVVVAFLISRLLWQRIKIDGIDVSLEFDEFMIKPYNPENTELNDVQSENTQTPQIHRTIFRFCGIDLGITDL
eukprot:TRINITY_DN9582_c0_g1_i2.p1 TRINITY_DN9582_c0_g1~~TRINITY_DN9582_c0_g1_i2.p1  ORF type:complete len:245 (-),score=10.33 TRINITY_DN9582_c0_g1_i2:94-828(-)